MKLSKEWSNDGFTYVVHRRRLLWMHHKVEEVVAGTITQGVNFESGPNVLGRDLEISHAALASFVLSHGFIDGYLKAQVEAGPALIQHAVPGYLEWVEWMLLDVIIVVLLFSRGILRSIVRVLLRITALEVFGIA